MRTYAITVRGGDAAYRVITRAENGTFTTPHFLKRDGKRNGKRREEEASKMGFSSLSPPSTLMASSSHML